MKKINLSVTVIIIAAVVIVAGLGLGFLWWGNYLERETPSIKFSQDVSIIGKQKKLDITFSDQKSGLSRSGAGHAFSARYQGDSQGNAADHRPAADPVRGGRSARGGDRAAHFRDRARQDRDRRAFRP